MTGKVALAEVEILPKMAMEKATGEV